MRMLILSMLLLSVAFETNAEEIGSVDTTWRALGANDKIVVIAFDDSKVSNVACYLSRAKKGGIKGSLGIAEDPSNAILSCRQIGPISLKKGQLKKLPKGENVFSEKASMWFKSINVVRFYDAKRNVLVYLSYSTKVIEGSRKNSVSVVPVLPWPKGEN